MAALALATGCASPPRQPISIEARGAIDGPYVVDAIAVVALLAVGGGSDAGTQNSRDHSYVLFDHDTFVRSFGFQASLNTPLIDLVGGRERHNLDQHFLTQENIGLRKRFYSMSEGERDSDGLYIQVLAIRGYSAKTDSGHEDYDAIGVGVGGLSRIDEHWFTNICVEYQSTFQRLQFDGDNSRQNSVSLNIGLGYSF